MKLIDNPYNVLGALINKGLEPFTHLNQMLLKQLGGIISSFLYDGIQNLIDATCKKR
jgi:hypothetical protein